VVDAILPFVDENQKYKDADILERMTGPDRIITFRVTWEDDRLVAALIHHGVPVKAPQNAIGTNMLGIGLHSYGFTDAAFFWFSVFIGSQVLVMSLGLGKRGPEPAGFFVSFLWHPPAGFWSLPPAAWHLPCGV